MNYTGHFNMARQVTQSLYDTMVSFFQNFDFDRKHTIEHFLEQGISRRLIQRVLQRFSNDGSVSLKPIPGRPRTVVTPGLVQKVKRRYIKHPSVSERQVAKSCKVNRSAVQRSKKQSGMFTRKKRKAPLYKDQQLARVKTNCRKLYDKNKDKFFLLDDETYIFADPSQIPGDSCYTECPGHPLSEEHKVKPKEKFPEKFMVWQRLAENGMVSEPFVTKKSMNQHVYRDECVSKISALIERLDVDREIIFWPDLATSHYAKTVIEELKKKNINFVPKLENPPNVPQCRPIERY